MLLSDAVQGDHLLEADVAPSIPIDVLKRETRVPAV